MKRRKILTALSMAFVFFLSGMKVHAVDVVQIPANEINSVYNQSVDSNQIEGWAQGPQIYSEAGIVMDMDSGAILYAKNIDSPHYPASITKILTALVALENNELTDIVTVTPEDYNFLESGDNHIGLKNKEEITMKDALYGTLLASGNEVAHAVASNTEGGYDHFIEMMNAKCDELGCTNSNFTNSHGLHDDEHYTSARDMALIATAAFQNEEFRTITSTLQYTIPETNITNETRTFQNHHKMLFDWRDQYYEYCVGGKTGYTRDALNTLVTYASKDGVNLVAVVLRTHGLGNIYVDTRAMLDYAYGSFSKVSVTLDTVEAEGLKSIEENSYVMLPNGVSFEQLDCHVENPTELEDKTGKVTYSYKGQIVGEFETTITDKYYNKIHGIKEIKEDKKDEEATDSAFSIVLKILIIVFIVIAVLFILLLALVAYRRAMIRKRKKAKRIEYRNYMEEMRNRED